MKVFYIMYIIFLLIIGYLIYNTVYSLKDSIQHSRSWILINQEMLK